MPSNDERREVAARLRFTDHNLTWSEGCFCIAEDVGAAPTGNEHDDVLAFAHALADLIEPEPERTCQIEMIDTGNKAAYEHHEHIAHWWQEAFKYVWRWPLKNGLQDIDKAIESLTELRKTMEAECPK